MQRGLSRFAPAGISTPPAHQILAFLGAAFIIILFGLISTTESPVLIALAAGTIIGPILLFKSEWLVTAMLVGGLFIIGLIQIFLPSLDRVSYLLSLFGVMLALRAYFGILTGEFRQQYVPTFVWIGAAIPIVFLAQSLVMSPSVAETVAGMKRLFHIWGLFLALALLPVPDRSFATWRKFLVLLAFTQLPFVLHQLIFLVPKRVGMGFGIVPHDIIAGTFGAFMNSGGSGAEMCIFLVVALAALIARWKEKLASGTSTAFLGLLIAAPLFLGENKIVVVFLPVAFLVLYRTDVLKKPFAFIFGASILGFLLAAALHVYLTYFSASKDLYGMVESTIAYNFGKAGYGALGLNRTTVLTFWWGEHGFFNPHHFLFGHGLGASSIAQGGIVTGHLGAKYGMLGISLTSLSTLLWDVGIGGTSLLLMMLYFAWQETLKVARSTDCQMRVSANSLLVAIALFVVNLPYRNSYHAIVSFAVMFAFLMGICGYLARIHHQRTAATTPTPAASARVSPHRT